jgi:hypothetical protein
MSNVIAWCVYDPATDELVLICASRSKARRVAAECGGRVAVIRRSN